MLSHELYYISILFAVYIRLSVAYSDKKICAAIVCLQWLIIQYWLMDEVIILCSIIKHELSQFPEAAGRNKSQSFSQTTATERLYHLLIFVSFLISHGYMPSCCFIWAEICAS